jgi:hypothetical protein
LASVGPVYRLLVPGEICCWSIADIHRALNRLEVGVGVRGMGRSWVMGFRTIFV